MMKEGKNGYNRKKWGQEDGLGRNKWGQGNGLGREGVRDSKDQHAKHTDDRMALMKKV